MKDKKELLEIAKKIKSELSSSNSSFISDIVSFIIASKIEKNSKEEQLKRFLEFLWFCTKNPNVLGGGNTKKNGFKKFIEDYLKLKKENGNFILGNGDFSCLDIDDLFFVFAWAKRVVKSSR
ncbi:hypothetical protein Calkr_2593 [Caldicellulosiruptor acetigenus I77R1B]|uniref:Uncharacterized protein n=1 Tax=Caldicellulosiruptor acetigenus (strain ATCC 700853 / DSM 12137 / I77R1B) TaxID=632335 RepID=E4S911_CALA7|nr:hypothetical protein [Caldicellulosiruptor acetigenus]ADQ42016.1 hypothetical protein Calkr_2593 [Caldicellulosiruptor acetigenus I77R1B]